MWIRTQGNELINLDKTIYLSITKVNHGDMNRRYINVFYWNDNKNILATYATEQRALEVLDEIQEHIETRVVADDMMLKLLNTSNLSDDDLKTKMRKLSCVYIMPKE